MPDLDRSDQMLRVSSPLQLNVSDQRVFDLPRDHSAANRHQKHRSPRLDPEGNHECRRAGAISMLRQASRYRGWSFTLERHPGGRIGIPTADSHDLWHLQGKGRDGSGDGEPSNVDETGTKAGLLRCEPSLSLARRAAGRVLLAWV